MLKQIPMVEIFDVMKDEDFLYHLEGQDETFFLVEKFFLGLCIQEKMACLNGINKNIHFIFFETGLVCAGGFGLRVRKLGASGFISNAENKDVLLSSITKILQGDKDFPEAVNYAVEHGEHLSTRATGELTDIEFDIAVDFVVDVIKNFVDFLLRIFVVAVGFAIELVAEFFELAIL